jgi:gas vesicle protein
MGRRRQSHAFRKGIILGGLAGAAVVIWNAPQPGARAREQIMETIEGVIFKLLDAPALLNGPRSSELPL